MLILLESEHFVVVDKPAQWLSVPGRDPKDSRKVLGLELQKSLARQIYPIHRLDAEVSGLMVYGKTAEFHKEANVLFEKKEIQKTYQAISTQGSFKKSEKVKWHSKILRGKKRTYEADFGKESLTEGFVFNKTEKYLDWRLQPITGRAHQLRFELSKHGCPILGDTLYGSQVPWSPGIALRAVELQLPGDFSEKWNIPQTLKTSLLDLKD